MSRNGSTARAWATLRDGPTAGNRGAVGDAAYALVYDGVSLRDVAAELGLERDATRALIEAAADRAHRRDWIEFDRAQNRASEKVGESEAGSRNTWPRSSQCPPVSAERRSKPDKTPIGTTTPPSDCPGCGRPLTGKRAGAKYHGDACRKRAKRAPSRGLEGFRAAA